MVAPEQAVAALLVDIQPAAAGDHDVDAVLPRVPEPLEVSLPTREAVHLIEGREGLRRPGLRLRAIGIEEAVGCEDGLRSGAQNNIVQIMRRRRMFCRNLRDEKEGELKARRLYQQAVERNPRFVEARVGILLTRPPPFAARRDIPACRDLARPG